MNPKDLRIGNRVIYSGSDWVVTGINSPSPHKEERWSDKYIVELYNNGLVNATIEEIQPIPLTEDILLKFGFITELNCLHPSCNYIYISVPENGIRLSFFLQKGVGLIKAYTLLKYGCYSSGTLTYLHELQNLYHSLTNTELEIKL